ncbi:MAG: immune inhibitor A [Thermoplasmatales archaeon]|nr:MAG: immune inhibitor A [Thermoplasmatales archaeon]
MINMKSKLICIFIFALFITISLSGSGRMEQSSISTKKYIDNLLLTKVLVRINAEEGYTALPRGTKVVGSKPGKWIDVILPRYKLISLSDVDYSVLIWDVEKYLQGVRGEYHTLAEIEDILENIADSYPDITSLYSIGTTYENRDIWCLEITDNPGVNEGELGVFLMGLHHAREWPTVEICLYIADQLTSEYGFDTKIKDLVDNRRIWLVTCLNPDGYYYCHDLGNDWRKNRRPIPGGIGVDLNRNYAGSSDGDPWGAWGSVGFGSISNNPSSEVYCGPMPFSEVETQAIRDIFLENDICASISWHTYGELVLIPWGYSYDDPPDDPYITQIGQQIASKITKQSGSGTYIAQQGAELYPTTGDTDDWAYGYAHYVQGRPTFAYTIEACNYYHPPASYLDQIVAENFDGALELLKEAENISDTVIPRVMPPVIDEVPIDPDGDYTVSWEEKNPDADPTKFQLDELIGPNIDIDDAESGSGYWSLDGFSLSTERYHSSSNSYKSGPGNNQVHSMTTVDPIPVTTGLEFDFWCWYDIEYNYDMAFVEVSVDGRSYEVLDSFTGSSGGWEQKQYSLDNYSGESIYLRFRYTTDDLTLEEGFYVDDILPVVYWDSIITLSDTITNNYYDITGKSDGTYYYLVKGYNSEHDWGDFSTLEKIIVDNVENDPPYMSYINGSTDGKVGEKYDYYFYATDPDGDNVSYYIKWGDGDLTNWTTFQTSGTPYSETHTWTKRGNYLIKAKAKDVYGAESDWATLEITMPKYYSSSNSFFLRFLENHPRVFPILRNLIRL